MDCLIYVYPYNPTFSDFKGFYGILRDFKDESFFCNYIVLGYSVV